MEMRDTSRNMDGTPPSGMSDQDFQAFATVIREQTGIVINPSKRSMLVSRLSRRMRALGLDDFSTYRNLLANDENSDERKHLISAITTNVTSFFREPTHFDALEDFVPTLAQRANSGHRVRLWSAGCSSGEEPYSIAMTLSECWEGFEQADARILATDIDSEMVERARRGVFPPLQNGQILPERVKRHAERIGANGELVVNQSLKQQIRFEQLNLLDPWPFKGMFDVIFCRNVVIYFDSETRTKLWRRFAERLNPGGLLFIGHSERIDASLSGLLEPSGVTQYRRIRTAGAAA